MTDMTLDQVQEWITWEATPGGRTVLRVTLKKDNLVTKYTARTFRHRLADEIKVARREALKDLNLLSRTVDLMDDLQEVAS